MQGAREVVTSLIKTLYARMDTLRVILDALSPIVKEADNNDPV